MRPLVRTGYVLVVLNELSCFSCLVEEIKNPDAWLIFIEALGGAGKLTGYKR
jgi:hypothetical protein